MLSSVFCGKAVLPNYFCNYVQCNFLFYNVEKKSVIKKKRENNFIFADSEKKLENPLKIVFSTRITRKWIF